MSSITGIFYKNGHYVDLKLIKEMNKRLSHRGPDGSNVWVDRSVAFGHQMLHTTPESIHETLPFQDEEAGLIITADARIDNRKELSKELKIEDKETIPDSYFILKSYQEWGEKCPKKLLGDFAFTIWDQNNEKLFSARDYIGIKPFYYYLSNEIFIFSTEIKALFTLKEVPYKLNEEKIATYLMDLENDKSTFYKDIFSLKPAHSITIDYDNSKIKRYWKLDSNSEIIMESDEDYAEAFREIFAEAVNCRLRSAFPLGFELSGGLDSSSVVCMAKQIFENNNHPKKEIKTFSTIYDEFTECDERYYIKQVLNTGGFKPYFILGDNISPLEQIENILYYQEEPFSNPFMPMLWRMYKKMQEKNVRVVLGGSGGDVTISYATEYLRELSLKFNWIKLIKELQGYSKRVNVGFCKLCIIQIIFQLIPEYLKTPYNKTRSPTFILNDEFAERVEAKKLLNELYLKPKAEAKTAKENHYLSIHTENLYYLEMLD